MITVHQELLDAILAEFPYVEEDCIRPAFPENILLADQDLAHIFAAVADAGGDVTMEKVKLVLMNWERERINRMLAAGYQLAADPEVDEVAVKKSSVNIIALLSA